MKTYLEDVVFQLKKNNFKWSASVNIYTINIFGSNEVVKVQEKICLQ